MEQPAAEQTDTFDSAVVAESTYVEPSARSRDAAGKFAAAKAAEAAESTDFDAPEPAEEPPAAEVKAEPVAESKVAKPEWEAENRRPTNAEARHDPKARIAQQTWDQRAAERRADEGQRENARLRAELDAARRPAAAATPPSAAVTAPADRFPRFEEWSGQHPDKTLDDYLDARDEFTETRRERVLTERAADSKKEQDFGAKATAFGERYKAAADADPDVVKRIDQRLLTAKPASALTKADVAAIRSIPDPQQREEFAFLCALAEYWVESEHAVGLLEHMSSNFQRLATLPPLQLSRELARVEASFGAASPKESRGSAPKPSASQAHAPFKPLGSARHTPDADDGSEDEPIESHIRRENTRDRKSGRLG